jgi:hypothetical protein
MAWQALTRGSWTGLDWAAPQSRLESDPYLIWADLTGFAGMGGPPAGPARVIAELAPDTSAAALDERLGSAGAGSVNPLYAGFSLAAPRFCTASVNAAFFGAWRNFGIRRYALCVPRRTNFIVDHFEQLIYVDASRHALIGVIDDGLPYLHERFRSAGKTRIVAFWDQGRDVFLDRAAIDRRLGQFDPSRPDRYSEARTYARDGYARLTGMETHGAGVLDLAAGGTPHEIACVQLPLETVADTSGASLAAQALDACHYILSHARPGQPVVINLSYGGYAGPHDGSGFLESALDDLCAFRPHDFAVVLAAGNGYDSECHARMDIPAGGSRRLYWEAPGNDATDSFLEIWGALAASGHPGLRVAVTPFDSARGDDVDPGEARMAQSSGVCPWCMVMNTVAPGNGRHQVLIALGPTLRSGPVARELAPSGLWMIEITNLGGALTVDAWIERDGPVGYFDLGGKQCRFKDPERQGYIDSGATLSSVANGAAAVVVGAYVKSTGDMSSYSSAGGSTRPGFRAGPDVAAPGDESLANIGLPVTTTRSGEPPVRMNGTSAAAPQVARLIADFLTSQSAPVAHADIKAWLASKAQSDDLLRYPPDSGSAVPPERAGAGRIKTEP